MAARCGNFDANRPGVNEHGDLIGKDGNTRKAARQVNVENNATAAVVNNIAATSQNDALNKNDSVIHVFSHNKCTYGVLSTDDQVTPANDVSTSAMKNINMTQNVLENEKPATFVTSLSDAANTNKEDTHGAANDATKEPGVFGNSLNVDANNNNNMRDKSICVQNDIHGTKEGTHATVAVGTGMKQSFASIFKTQFVSKAVRLTTMTSEFVQGANVAIPLAAVEEVSQRFENTLYGYFIGKRLAFPLVETYVKNAWAKFGLERTMLTNGFFFFQFATREGMERVLKNGSWLIRLVPIFLNIWTPNTVLKKDTITSAPIRVKLHHVLIVAFSEIGLSLITS
ncbi:zinc knuckle CX2CX4HX4C containing protein [Tanacetum coccineum]